MQAHDNLIGDVHRSQAVALAIRARAEMRLAEEYDQANASKEIAGHGGNRGNQHTGGKVEAVNLGSIGLRKDEIHSARGAQN